MNLALIFLTTSLSFVYSIPGTNALRYFIALLLLLASSIQVFKKKDFFLEMLFNKEIGRIIIAFLVLTNYILLHIIFQSHDVLWSVKAFKGHWAVPLIMIVIGGLLAIVFSTHKKLNPKVLITSLFFGLMFHIAYVDIASISNLLQNGELLTRYSGLVGSPVNISYIADILLAMTVADLINRLRGSNGIILISTNYLLFAIALILFSTIVSDIRNGMISIFFIFILGVYFLYKSNDLSSYKKNLIVLISFIVISLPIGNNFFTDNRWGTLIETFKVASDTDKYSIWYEMDKWKLVNSELEFPKINEKERVNPSNYLRLAWIFKSIDYLAKDPMGIGFGRNAFGHFIQKYDGIDSARGFHSHSSVIDLALAVGLPWIFMWFLTVALILYTFYKSLKIQQSFYPIFGFLLTASFFMRSFIDSNMRDHPIQQFAIIFGILLVLNTIEKIKNSQDEKDSAH